MKRKEKLASLEKDRFNKNMAQMMNPGSAGQQDQDVMGGTEGNFTNGNKWAALRSFIQQTMEQRPNSGS